MCPVIAVLGDCMKERLGQRAVSETGGQIVGLYDDAGGTTHGFLATPVPEI